MEDLKPGEYIDFAIEDSSKSWDFVLSDIKKYLAEEINWKQNIADTAIRIDSTGDELNKLTVQFQKWLKITPNPLDELARKLDPILNDFGIKIKTDIDKETILHLGNIVLQTLNGEDLDKNFWSTGTKHIIDSAVPLIEIKPQNAIILIDEPERSLYPNLQRKVIDFFISLGNDCQYIFATHSAIVASSFDPWEIVELKFDESNSFVIEEKNYVGKKHVDNYNVYPKYLEWGDILMKLFDMNDEGSDYRGEELLNMVTLKNELKTMKMEKKNKGVVFERKLKEFIQLKQKLGWNEEVR